MEKYVFRRKSFYFDEPTWISDQNTADNIDKERHVIFYHVKERPRVWCPIHRYWEEIGHIDNDACLTDCGVHLKGYNLDFTRTRNYDIVRWWLIKKSDIITLSADVVLLNFANSHSKIPHLKYQTVVWQIDLTKNKLNFSSNIYSKELTATLKSVIFPLVISTILTNFINQYFYEHKGRTTIAKSLSNEAEIRCILYAPFDENALQKIHSQLQANISETDDLLIQASQFADLSLAIDKFNFRIIDSRHMLKVLFKRIEHEITPNINLKQTIFSSIDCAGRYLGYIESIYSPTGHNYLLKNLYITNEHHLSEQLTVAVFYWLAVNRFNCSYRVTNYHCIKLIRAIDMNKYRRHKFSVHKLSLDERPYDAYSFSELTTLPRSRMQKGFYSALYRRMQEKNNVPVSPPPWLTFSTERDKLKYMIPYGEELVEAAYFGNSEAQNVLGLIYSDNIFIPRNIEKSLFWLKEAACNGTSSAFYSIALLYAEAGDEINAKKFYISAAKAGITAAWKWCTINISPVEYALC